MEGAEKTSSDFDTTIERYHKSLDDLLRGDPGPAKALFSSRTDVTLANPFGPAVRGKKEVDAVIDRAAAGFRDGKVAGFERLSGYVTPELAYIVETERLLAKLDGSSDISPFALRVTSVLRREDGGWKVVHRHADPITSARPMDSVVQK